MISCININKKLALLLTTGSTIASLTTAFSSIPDSTNSSPPASLYSNYTYNLTPEILTDHASKTCQVVVTGRGYPVRFCKCEQYGNGIKFIVVEINLKKHFENDKEPTVDLWVETDGYAELMPVIYKKRANYLPHDTDKAIVVISDNRVWDSNTLSFALKINGEWDSNFNKNYELHF